MVQRFRSDDVSIAYIDEGEGDPIILIHGFASNHRVNWVSTGWVSMLTGDGRRVIALDNRGHGESDKPHDPAAYGTP
ncbi:MAG TPA: alpha/beta fold hydrolase, partial [Afifellaceae bacterium]|nr:alpha/beta fold hydrolase [Afifellaceae bacterium]